MTAPNGVRPRTLEAVAAIKQVSAGKGNRLYEVSEVFALLDRFETDPSGFIAPR